MTIKKLGGNRREENQSYIANTNRVFSFCQDGVKGITFTILLYYLLFYNGKTGKINLKQWVNTLYETERQEAKEIGFVITQFRNTLRGGYHVIHLEFQLLRGLRQEYHEFKVSLGNSKTVSKHFLK